MNGSDMEGASGLAKSDQELVTDYFNERAAPWRLVGRYEQALRQIRDTLDGEYRMATKLDLIRRNIDAADLPADDMPEGANNGRKMR